MTDAETAALKEELEQFRQEKERIRVVVGQIGGKRTIKRDRIINIVFIVILLLLLLLDILRHYFHLKIPLPDVFSLEVGLLLVSLKIIWMIHNQSRVEHFQFWILNSIEFRLNDIAKRIKQVEKTVMESSN